MSDKGTVAALVLSVVTGFAGYHLNSYLSLDHITIQNVILIPEKVQLTFATDTLTPIIRCESDLSLGFSLARFGYLQPNQDGRTPITRGAERTVENSLFEYQRAAEFLLGELNNYTNYLSTVNTAMAPTDTMPQDFRQYLIRAELLTATAEDFTVSSARVLIGYRRQRVMDCLRHIDTGIEVASIWRTTSDRTGQLALLVALLNSGDTDGLVRSSGTLTVDGIGGTIVIGLEPEESSSPLPPRLAEYPPAAVRVERRAMTMQLFSLDEGPSTTDAFRLLQAEIKDGGSIAYALELIDIRDNTISYAGTAVIQ